MCPKLFATEAKELVGSCYCVCGIPGCWRQTLLALRRPASKRRVLSSHSNSRSTPFRNLAYFGISDQTDNIHVQSEPKPKLVCNTSATNNFDSSSLKDVVVRALQQNAFKNFIICQWLVPFITFPIVGEIYNQPVFILFPFLLTYQWNLIYTINTAAFNMEAVKCGVTRLRPSAPFFSSSNLRETSLEI